MKRTIAVLAISSACLSACSWLHKSSSASEKKAEKKDLVEAKAIPAADTAKKIKTPQPETYRAARTLVNDLLHTRLWVKFDFEKQWMYGKAVLSFKPYARPSFYLDLDAKSMEIKKVAILNGKDTSNLKYEYDGSSIKIALDKVYKNDEEFNVFIDYIAKPNEVKQKGSAAINDAKGLYFINPLGKDADKPTQIWTQGETESNSCWFPTIDSPNEKMTQEISITVPDKYLTLSNGLMTESQKDNKGMRTDTWKQKLPAAPYLTMMAIGEFAVIPDKWRNIDVNYYVEKEYQPYARKIFGNTPEMLEFYSQTLGVAYPWEKFSQIVVRDYVSGAMENTSAVIHGEFLQSTARELLDGDNEEVIAHELFHHWFGDLVTAESWSNLTVNESFATYGEYMWNEHKYGRDQADFSLNNDLNNYLAQAQTKRGANLVRFDYEDKEDMFDGVSYQKGGRILHMLRKYLGDAVFYNGLKIYLTENKFKAAEAHHLRLAMEQASGEDLNWFFNQWYFNHGHPEITISHQYNDTTKTENVSIEQTQDFDKNPLFTLPIKIDYYHDGKVESQNFTLTKAKEEIKLPATKPGDLINIDAEKMLLAVKKENKAAKEWIFMYYNAPLYLDRFEALSKIAGMSSVPNEGNKMVFDAMSDKHWNIRNLAIKNVKKAIAFNKELSKDILVDRAEHDPKSSVRAAAIKALAANYEGDDLKTLYKNAIAHDSSYRVLGEALGAYAKTDKDEALAMAKAMENDKSEGARGALVTFYTEKGTNDNNAYLVAQVQKANGGAAYGILQQYGKYLKRADEQTISKSLYTLEDIATNKEPWYVRLSAVQVLNDIQKRYEEQELEASGTLSAMKADTSKKYTEAEIAALEAQVGQAKAKKDNIDNIVKKIKAGEKNEQLKKYYGISSEKTSALDN